MTPTTDTNSKAADDPGLDRVKKIMVGARNRGLPGLAQGGYTSGLVAEAVGTSAVEVSLRRPVPAERPLGLHTTGPGRVELREGQTVLSEGVATDLEIDVPEAPSVEEALAASERFPGRERHPVPGCYVCGTDDPDGRGLGIHPGPVGTRPLVAAIWAPPAVGEDSGRTPLEEIWAAFDCTQLWALIVHQESRSGERAVTARLATRVDRPVVPSLDHLLFGWPIGRRGDEFRAGAALIDGDGNLCAVGVQTAVRAKWGVPLGSV